MEEKATDLQTIPGYKNGIDYKKLSSAMPYMYSDEPERIDFVADAGIVDQIVDWFGNDIRIAPNSENENQVKVSVVAIGQCSMQIMLKCYLPIVCGKEFAIRCYPD